MIKVIHIVEDLRTGGLERTIAEIVMRLNKDKFRAGVWCLSRGGEIYEELKGENFGAEILFMPPRFDLRFIFKLCDKLKKEKVHILHAHGYTAATIGRTAGLLAGVPVMISHVHSTYWNYTSRQVFIERCLSYFTDMIICCSGAAADFVVKYEGINSGKVKVIYNGINLEKYEIKDSMAGLKEKKEFKVGCIASLFPHKGHRYLMEAAEYIKNETKYNVKYILAGDGILMKDLKNYAEKLGISDQVEFKGIVSDIPGLIASLDLVVLPSSEREGLGISLIEAMAAGKPVIGTDIGGIPEVIENGKNGFLVPPKNFQALAEAIISILENTDKGEGMGAQGKETAGKKFSGKVMIKNIENLYQDLIYEKSKKRKN